MHILEIRDTCGKPNFPETFRFLRLECHPGFFFHGKSQLIIAVGSNRKPKLNALTAALGPTGPKFCCAGMPDVLGVEVDSGVGHRQLSREECMRGARKRAEALARLA